VTRLHPLISPEKLAGTLDDVVICDIRWDLTDREKGRDTYRSGHIPGAVFVDLDTQLAAPPGDNGRHPLPDPVDFATTVGNLGITPDSHVVVYDDAGGRMAARLWWMLRSIEHEKVQVLDGGYQAWLASHGFVATGDVTPDPAHYPAPTEFSGTVTHPELESLTLIDARAGERYRGETEPVDPKAGHIPGAINIPTDANLDETGAFRPSDELAAVYEGMPDNVAVSCGSGVTSCHTALAMVVAGHSMPAVYVGSFSEWSRLDLPVNTGPTP
jgi:thiosulfate/3-mercaptopyruvate sulfurtransferase